MFVEVLSKENIVEPMRDIRRALLEADVSCLFNMFFELSRILGSCF